MGSTRQTFSEDRQANTQPSPAPDSSDNPILLIWRNSKQTNKQKIFGQSLNLAISYITTLDIQNKEIRWKLGRNIDFVQLIFFATFLNFYLSLQQKLSVAVFQPNLSSFIFWRVLKIWILSWFEMINSGRSEVKQLNLVKAILSSADEDTKLSSVYFLRMKASRLKEWKSLSQLWLL